MRDRDGIVDRRAVPAVPASVPGREEAEEIGEDAPSPGAERHPRVALRDRDDCLVRDVDRDLRDGDPAAEDARRGVRVDPDIELRTRRPVPLAHRSAHEADPRDPRPELGVRAEEEGDVRERPSWH